MEDSQQVSQFKSKSGLARIFSAFSYSLQGLKTAWRNEHAFRQELFIVVPGIVIALALPLSPLEKVALIGVLIILLIVELLNSAIEAVVDRISFEHHPLSKNAKDLGSAAVMLTLILAGLTWAVIVLPLFRH
ncbi:diacylglycerol kinase [Oxalobacteraceae bacterium OM1]|nr:diacylglycerol kinase [Oxalobacteraceae bacterium OM1]